MRWTYLLSSEAEIRNFSWTKYCFLLSRIIFQNGPSFDSACKNKQHMCLSHEERLNKMTDFSKNEITHPCERSVVQFWQQASQLPKSRNGYLVLLGAGEVEPVRCDTDNINSVPEKKLQHWCYNPQMFPWHDRLHFTNLWPSMSNKCLLANQLPS